jgi:hypothetical protein
MTLIVLWIDISTPDIDIQETGKFLLLESALEELQRTGKVFPFYILGKGFRAFSVT